MATVKFRILGEPMGKQRARMTKWGTHTPKETVNYETLVKQVYMTEVCQRLDGQIEICITAYFKIPQSVSKKKKQLMIDGKIRPTKTPDYDNIAKIISDSLNSIAYDDDKQIVDATVRKFYSDIPRVEVKLSEVG